MTDTTDNSAENGPKVTAEETAARREKVLTAFLDLVPEMSWTAQTLEAAAAKCDLQAIDADFRHIIGHLQIRVLGLQLLQVEAPVDGLPAPLDFEPLEVVAIDLVQGRILGAAGVAAVIEPFAFSHAA